MTLDERQDWIGTSPLRADVTAAQTLTLDSETVEGPPKGASEVEEDFGLTAGELMPPLSTSKSFQCP